MTASLRAQRPSDEELRELTQGCDLGGAIVDIIVDELLELRAKMAGLRSLADSMREDADPAEVPALAGIDSVLMGRLEGALT